MDHTVVPERIMDRIYVQDWIYLIYQIVLLVFNLWQYIISNIRNKAFRCLEFIDVFDGL